MYSLNKLFFKRVKIAVYGLLGLVVFFIVVRTFFSGCTLSNPYNKYAPIIMQCAPPVTISLPFASPLYDEAITPTRHIITTFYDWTKTQTLKFNIQSEFLPITQHVSMQIPSIIPAVFFSESANNNTTSVFQIQTNRDATNISKIFTDTDMSNINFDETSIFTYLKNNPTTQTPEVDFYRLETQKKETYLKPLLGKTFDLFAPNQDHSGYAWQEHDSDTTRVSIVSANDPSPHTVELTSKPSALQTTPVYAGDLDELLLIEPTTNQVAVFDMYEDFKTESPVLKGKIIAVGFTGPDKTIPFVSTTSGIWIYQEPNWKQKELAVSQMTYVACTSGDVYMSPTDISIPNCATLRITTDSTNGINAILSTYNGVKKQIYEL